jgi:Na+/melibiose symporter-like transporter
MAWDNLINIVVHPWAGVRSDHTWTRWGRRKPWILIGLPMPSGPPGTCCSRCRS